MKRTSDTDKSIRKIVMVGLMMGLILVATSLFKIPVPMSQGYVHLGDAMIFLGVLVLGRNQGALAAGLGSALGDILGGYAMWAPWTFVIKFLMAFIMGLIIDALQGKREMEHPHKTRVTLVEGIAMVFGGLWMCLGYFLAERVIYGTWAAAAIGIPWNIGQFVVGIVASVAIATALWKTPVKQLLLTHGERA